MKTTNFKKSHQALLIVLSFLAPISGLGSDKASPRVLSDLDHAFIEAAEAAQIDVNWLRAMCWAESNHRIPKLKAIDGVAIMPSYGICQIQYQTAQRFGFTGTAKELRLNNHINTHYAAKVLKYWLDKAKGNYRLAVSAYNRGHFKKSMRIGYVCKILIALHEGR